MLRPRSIPASLATAVISLALITGLALAQELLFLVYLPAVYLEPSATPTVTPTPTITPTVTRTPAIGSIDKVQGSLALCNPGKTNYVQLGHGHGLVRPGRRRGEQTPHPQRRSLPDQLGRRPGVLGYLCGGCTGPLNGSGGAWQDNIRGLDNNEGFESPGSYQLTFAVCYTNYSACPSAPSCQWRSYTSIVITVQ